LIVDDDERIVRAFSRSLRKDKRREVFVATSASLAREVARHEKPDLALIDWRLETGSGLEEDSGAELLREFQAAYPRMTLVVVSGWMSVETAVEAVHSGARFVFCKPVTPREILNRVEGNEPAPSDLEYTPTLARAEWEHIARVMADCHGNVSHAALRLGVMRQSLQRKLRRAPRR
jgi:two-component system response regulator RegA